MDLLHAALLGIIQGLTEFLPVSSSGHLRLAHAFFDFESGNDLFFDICVHVATLLAVCFVYRRRVLSLMTGTARAIPSLARHGPAETLRRYPDLLLLVLIVVATIPTGVIGLLVSDVLASEHFPVMAVGGFLILNGFLLASSAHAPTPPVAVGGGAAGQHEGDRGADSPPLDRNGGSDGMSEVSDGLRWAGIGFRVALLIGIAQGLATMPGISRSGATIVCALWLGAHPLRAAEFSFLLSIPAILGALVLEFDPAALTLSGGGWLRYGAGAGTAAITGVIALLLLLRLLREAKFSRFSWYCWLLGGAAVVWSVIA